MVKKNGIVFDPGMFDYSEKSRFDSFIADQQIQLTRLINTHCHLDHIFGNQHIYDTYGLLPEFHKGEESMYEAAEFTALSYGLPPFETPKAKSFLHENDHLLLGNQAIKIMLTPGHSAASLSFYLPKEKLLIAGDVIFNGSIGRTDLPGGDYDTLINSIATHILTLADDVTIYCGHGPKTTVGHERHNNPFLQSLN